MNLNYKRLSRFIGVLLVALFSMPTFAQNVDCSGVAEWVSQSYSGGQKAVKSGSLYEANWWTTTDPSTNNGGVGSGQPWALLGSCGVAEPEITLTSLSNGQNVYLQASQTQALEVSIVGSVDSVQYIVVDRTCSSGGCTEVNRYNITSAPFSYDLAPNFAATYTEISVVAFKNGQGFSGNTVRDLDFHELPEIHLTSPGNGQPFHLDAEANETVTLSSVVTADVDSVQYIVVDILCNGPGCAQVNRYTVTSAPYDYELTPTFGASYTEVTAVAFKNGQGFSSTSHDANFYALPKVNLTSVGKFYYKSDEKVEFAVDVNDEVARIDSVTYIVVNVLCNGPGCADVQRYTVYNAPFDLEIDPTFGASHSEVTALAYAHGVGANSQTVDFEMNALAELQITNIPPTGGKVYVDATAPFTLDVDVNVNDEDVAIDSVEYVLVQISGFGNSTNYHEVHKTVTEAPFNISFEGSEAEARLGQTWTKVVAIPYGDEGKTAGAYTVTFDLLALPTVEITNLNDGHEHYLKASTNPTIDVEVAVNDDISEIDSVYYIVVDLLCNGPGCAESRRFTETEAPYTLTFEPNLAATYTEIYAIAFSNGRASNASYHITNYFNALPEASFVNIADGQDVTVDANNRELFVDIDVNDELVQIDSVQYILVQHEGYGPYPTVRELYRTVTTAPFDITFASEEIFLDQNWTRVIAIPFGDGGKTVGSISAQINVIGEDNSCDATVWTSGVEYCGGSEVAHNGLLYTADWCTTAEPGTGQWIGWTETGVCGSARVLATEEATSLSTSVYPNPFANSLTITNAESFNSYVVTNVLGNVVAQGTIEGNATINTADWASGAYVVTLVGETTKSISVIK